MAFRGAPSGDLDSDDTLKYNHLEVDEVLSSGASTRRREDVRLITGNGEYVDNLQFNDCYYAAILRSPSAHAKINKVDASEALKHPKVVAVVTPDDVVSSMDSFPVGITAPMKYYPTAITKTRYSGEPVAVVVARDKYSAEDALELVSVDYERLDAVVDPERAMEKNVPVLHEEIGSNVAWHRKLEYGNVEEEFRKSDVVVKKKFRFPRYTSAPLEPYAVVAKFEPSTGLTTVWSNFQGPWTMFSVMTKAMRASPEKLRLIVPPDIGGGFGIKTDLYPYIVLIALAAIKSGKLVKWVETRREHMLASSSQTDRVFEFEVAAKKDGTITALRARTIDNVGAYVRPPEPGCILRSLGNFTGPYRIRSLSLDAYVVVTNKCPTGPNRGYGCQHLYFGLERIMDTLANKLRMDPADMRFRNLIPPNEFPYSTITGGIYDAGDYPKTLKTALKLVEYDKFREEQRRARLEGRYLGLGIAVGVDPSVSNMGYVTVAFPPDFRGKPTYLPKSGSASAAMVKMDPSGKVIVTIDSNPQGQSHETVVADLVARELGISADDVSVDAHFDTFRNLWAISAGTYSSRFSSAGASAVVLAARKVKEKVFQIAGHLLEARIEDLEVSEGMVRVKGAPQSGVTVKRIAGTAYWNPSALPQGMEPGIVGSGFFDFPNLKPPDPSDRVNSSATYGFIADIVTVEVEPRTGLIRILKYVSSHDEGTVLNETTLEGQIVGSIFHGFAGSIYEELVYDDEGQLLTSTFSDYLCPTAKEAIRNISIAHVETPSPVTLLGSKGAAESSTETAPAAIGNAVNDALAPFGVDVTDMPLTPEKVWRLSRQAHGKTQAVELQ